jgi:hypothetical protein
MITKNGKDILAKYLIGQAPAYASYIAIGCGAKPLGSAEQIKDYTNQQTLDFEMFRVPIISRGYVTELDNENKPVSKVVFTAELPSEERYEISEIGIYSAASNPSALNADSKNLFSFNNQNENWEYHTQSAATSIPVRYGPLDINTTGDGASLEDSIAISDIVFNVNSDNEIFSNSSRIFKNEVPRLLNNSIAIRGDDADLQINKKTINSITVSSNQLVATTSSSHGFTIGEKVDISGAEPVSLNVKDALITNVLENTFTVSFPSSQNIESTKGGFVEGKLENFDFTIAPESNHIHFSGISLDLDKNSPNDLLKIAFSLVGKTAVEAEGGTDNPDSIKILLEFASTEVGDREYARLETTVYNAPASETGNFSNNRYFVASSNLQDLVKSPGFTWSNVRVVKIYASVYETPANPANPPVLSNNFYISLDGLRFENLSSTTPLYGLSGYSVVRNPEKRTIVKEPNSSNLLEFRFGLGIE